MTGRGHMFSGTALIVINDRLIYMLSKLAEKPLATFSETTPILGSLKNVDFFQAYRDFVLRVWVPHSMLGTWVEKFLTVMQLLIFLILFWLACFLPDIDQPNSTFGQRFYIPCKHRTWTHTIWAASLFLIPGIWLPPFFWIGYAYMLHLIVDAFSRGGVCFFYPISKYVDYPSGAHVKKHHIFKLYKPGGSSETVICVLLIIAAVVLAFGPIIIEFVTRFTQNVRIA